MEFINSSDEEFINDIQNNIEIIDIHEWFINWIIDGNDENDKKNNLMI